MEQDNDPMWNLASSIAAVAAAGLAMKVMTKAWIRARGSVPGNPARGESSWAEATAWAVASGVVVGVVRLAAQRGVAAYFDDVRASAPSSDES